MAFEKRIIVKLMLICVLLHTSFSPKTGDTKKMKSLAELYEDPVFKDRLVTDFYKAQETFMDPAAKNKAVADINTSKETYFMEQAAKSKLVADIYTAQETYFKDQAAKSKLMDDIYKDPAAKSKSIAEIYESQEKCVKKIYQVFTGKSFVDHIKQGMISLTYSYTFLEKYKSEVIPNIHSNILPDMFVFHYYLSLENFLQPGKIEPAHIFCIEESEPEACSQSIKQIFTDKLDFPMTAVKRAFGLHTRELISKLGNYYLIKYYDHVIDKYTVNTRKSTSPEAYCSYYYGLKANTNAHLEYTSK